MKKRRHISGFRARRLAFYLKIGGLLGALVLIGLVTYFLLSARSEQRALDQSAANLYKLRTAMSDYHKEYRCLPAAAIYSKDGKPLLSWRVALLPFLDEGALYKQFKLDEPWDSQANLPLVKRIPKVYAPVRGKPEPGTTYYQVFVGKGTLFDGQQGIRLVQIDDGTLNTILLVEAGQAVPWTKPEDLPYDAIQPLPSLGGLFKGRFHVVFMEGPMRFVEPDFDEQLMRNAITRNDRKEVDPFRLGSEVKIGEPRAMWKRAD